MGFFSSISKIFSSVVDPIKNIAAGMGLYTPASVKRQQNAMQAMQAQLEKETAERKRLSEQEKMTEEKRLARVKQRSKRGRRRSLLFDDEENGALKETLG